MDASTPDDPVVSERNVGPSRPIRLVESALAPQRWYVLGILAAVYAINIADRFVMSTLIEPIKADLHLSDAAIGFVTGVALALFYVTAGLPIAVLADRANRRNIIAAALGLWSLMTALCSMTQNFAQLLVARFGVGVGEAGGTPPSISLLCDYFKWQQRAFALSLYSTGATIGSMLGLMAGYASDAWGWRSAFWLLGVPGLILAAVLALTVKEPHRGQLDLNSQTQRAGLFETLRFVFQQPALLHSLLGGSVFTLWAWGLMWWTPSYLVRSHHLTVGSAGGYLSLMHGVGGSLVLCATSILMKRFSGRDPRIVPWFVGAVILVGTMPSVIAYCTTSTRVALVMLWIFIPLSYAVFGPLFALVQNLVPAHMRSQAMGLLLFSSNVANLVLAPQIIGVASDQLAARYGMESLRVALIPLACTGFWAAYHFFVVGWHIREGLVRAHVAQLG